MAISRAIYLVLNCCFIFLESQVLTYSMTILERHLEESLTDEHSVLAI